MTEPADLLLVRHGRTGWHRPNRYAGRTDIDIDDVGAAQAAALGDWARHAGLTALYSSPMARTLATARPAAAATGLPIQRLESLREIDFGVAEGRTLQEMADADPAATATFLDDPVTGHWPGGDDPAARAEQAVADLAAIAARHPGRRILVVAHSTLLRVVLCRLLGIPLRRYREALGRPDPTAVTNVRWDGISAARMTSFNVPVTVDRPPPTR